MRGGVVAVVAVIVVVVGVGQKGRSLDGTGRGRVGRGRGTGDVVRRRHVPAACERLRVALGRLVGGVQHGGLG